MLRSPEKNDESKRVKCVAVFLVVSFCVLIAHIRRLRPLFPIKPEPPLQERKLSISSGTTCDMH